MSEAAYASASDFSSVLDATLVTELQGTSGDVDKALLDASRELDAYLGQRYVIPVDLTASPKSAPILRQRTVAIAKYLFLSRKMNAPVLAVDVAKEEYLTAVTWSRDVAKKLADLPDAPLRPIEDPSVTVGRTPLLFGGEPPVFVGDDFLSF